MNSPPWQLFEVLGLELEYMIVDAETLSVRPISDRLLAEIAGEIVSEVELGAIAWSNELVLHVLELKTNGPTQDLVTTLQDFQANVRRAEEIARSFGARLMPTAMHPWMNPSTETRLWPHDYSPVYQAYDRIFSCQGHGWSNLQSQHLNLPFANDEEFGQLHAAVRLILPLLPALAASSPILDGHPNGILDNRLAVYRTNSQRVPSVAGMIVPEPAFDRAAYERLILEPMYREIGPLDPDQILQHEFLNSRGAIARFGRGSIEIRLLDLQECPRADLAIAFAVEGILRLLVEETWSPGFDQRSVATEPLAALLEATTRDAAQAEVTDTDYLALFGVRSPLSAGALWKHLIDQLVEASPEAAEPWIDTLSELVHEGPLASRILRAAGPNPDRRQLAAVYRSLCDCLVQDRLFTASGDA